MTIGYFHNNPPVTRSPPAPSSTQSITLSAGCWQRLLLRKHFEFAVTMENAPLRRKDTTKGPPLRILSLGRTATTLHVLSRN